MAHGALRASLTAWIAKNKAGTFWKNLKRRIEQFRNYFVESHLSLPRACDTSIARPTTSTSTDLLCAACSMQLAAHDRMKGLRAWCRWLHWVVDGNSVNGAILQRRRAYCLWWMAKAIKKALWFCLFDELAVKKSRPHPSLLFLLWAAVLHTRHTQHIHVCGVHWHASRAVWSRLYCRRYERMNLLMMYPTAVQSSPAGRCCFEASEFCRDWLHPSQTKKSTPQQQHDLKQPKHICWLSPSLACRFSAFHPLPLFYRLYVHINIYVCTHTPVVICSVWAPFTILDNYEWN